MKSLFVLAAATAAVSSFAQINFSGSYSQNFNSLASAGTGLAWADNLPTASMPGWYANTPPASYDADNGANGTPGLYSYGSILTTGLPDTERALGSVSLPGAILVYGMRLLNTSGGTFTSLTIGFRMEQWRSGSTTPETVDFAYNPTGTDLWSGTWTSHNALDLNAVDLTGVGAIDGNATFTPLSSTITGLNWTSGTEMWVRWLHIGNGSNHGLAIDDMTMTANPVPEPFTMGLAMAGLGLAARKRMRRRA